MPQAFAERRHGHGLCELASKKSLNEEKKGAKKEGQKRKWSFGIRGKSAKSQTQKFFKHAYGLFYPFSSAFE